MKTVSTVVLMTEKEARAAHDKIWKAYRDMGTEIGEMLLEMKERRGFEKMGHKTFEAYVAKEFLESRRTIYNLMTVAGVAKNVGKSLPVRQAALLAELTEEEQREAFAEVKDDPSEARVKKAVAKRRKSKPAKKPKHDDSQGWDIEEMKKSDPPLLEAFKVIAKVYGNEDTKAIRTGTLGLKRADVIQLAGLPETKQKEIHELIMANHWTPKQSMEFLSRMPNDDTTVDELKNLCLSKKGFYWEGDFDGFKITVTATRAIKRIT